MKKILNTLMLTFLILASASCEKPFQEPDYKQCELSIESIVLEGPEGTGSFDIATTREAMWRITPAEGGEWLSFDVKEGKSSDTVSYSFTSNPTLEKRETSFRFEALVYGDRFMDKTIKVVQMPSAPYIEFASDQPLEISLSYSEGKHMIPVFSNMDWTFAASADENAETPVDWMSIPESSFNRNAEAVFEVKVNVADQERTAWLTFSNAEKQVKKVIKVTQEIFKPEVVEGVSISFAGMTGYLPQTGHLVMYRDFDDKTLEFEANVAETTEPVATVITFPKAVEAGVYQLVGFKLVTGELLEIKKQCEIKTDTKEIFVEGWDNNFKTFGGLSPDDPIHFSTVEDLKNFANVINTVNGYADHYFVLDQDIDLGGSLWKPIGYQRDFCFKGHFDGQNHKVSGLRIQSQHKFQGLFGVVSGKSSEQKASVKNVHLISTAADGQYDIDFVSPELFSAGGSIAGLVENAVISGCSSDLKMKIGAGCGGIVGQLGDFTEGLNQWPTPPMVVNLGNSLLEDCHFNGTILFQESGPYFFNGGGIVGTNKGIVKRSSNAGKLTVSSPKFVQTGGIVGTNLGNIAECYNTGEINTSKNTGGIAGFVANSISSITDCYNTGAILVNEVNVGGLVGLIANAASLDLKILNCYSIGEKSPQSGSLFGCIKLKGKVTIRFCTADKAPLIADPTNKLDGDTERPELLMEDRVAVKTFADLMKLSTFTTTPWASTPAAWDFTNVWTIDEGSSTPYLRNNEQKNHPGK